MGTQRPTTPQSLTVEYTVTGSLDGTTPAPELQIDQHASDATPFDEDAQIFRPESVEHLGLIDPDLLVGGSIGTRCIPFLSIDTDQTGAGTASCDVVGVRGGSPSDVFFQKQIRDLAGTAGPIFIDEGFNVPQGSDIRLRGFTVPEGEELRVRVSLMVPADCGEVAAFRCACDGATGAQGPTGATGATGVTGPTGAGENVCLNNYLVSPDEETAPYQLISAAYAAAKAAGHNAANPAKILVCPGEYTDDVLMDTAGIDVIAVAGDSQTADGMRPHGYGQTRMLGTLEIDMASAGSMVETSARWEGIDILSEDEVTVTFSGEDAQYFYLTDCQLLANATVVEATNTGVDGTSSSLLNIQRCNIDATEEADLDAIEIDSAGALPVRVILVNTMVRGTGHVAVVTNGYIGFSACFAASTDSCVVLDGSILYGVDSYFGSDEELAEVPAGSVVEILDCKLNIDTAPFITGLGFFYHDAMSFYRGFVPAWDTTLRPITSQGIPQESNIVEIDVSAGPYEITSETNVSVIGPGTLTVPPTAGRPGVLRLKESADSAGVVTVAAQGIDTIRIGDETPAATVTLTSQGFFLVADPGNSLWEGWACCGPTCLTDALVATDPARAPFQSIQDAYDYLVSIGAGSLAPAKVLVCPGVYTEDVTMSIPGIDIIAVAPDDYDEMRQNGWGHTRLNGTLTIDLTGAAATDEQRTCSWRGIDIFAQLEGASESAVLFTGTHFQLGFITNSYLIGVGSSPALKQDNSGTSILGDSTLDIIRCCLRNPSISSAAGFECDDGTLLMNDSVTRGSQVNTIAAGALVVIQDCSLENGVEVTGEIDAWDSSINNIDIAAGGIADITRCDMSTGPAGVLGGTFIFDSVQTYSAATVAGFSSALATTQKSSVPQGGGVNYYTGAGPHQLDGSETNVVVDPDDEVAVVVLPPALARRGPIRIKQLAGSGGSLNVDTVGIPAETINNAAAPLVGIGTAGKTFVGWVSPPFGPPNDWETYA